jgi:uncharacterized protein YggT (Ycf19 family)
MALLIRLIEAAAFVYVILIAVRALMTWLKPEVLYTYKKFFELTAGLVDPLLIFVRKAFPVNIGRVDLSPVIAVVLVETAKYILVHFIRMLMAGGTA